MKLTKYGDLNTHDVAKFLAITFMIIDHIGYYLWDLPEFRVVGRLCCPIFSVIYGYHFKDKIKIQLAIWATPVVLLDILIKRSIFPLNVLFTFLFSSIIIVLVDRFKSRMKSWDIVVLLFLSLILHFFLVPFIEYGSFILWFMICGYLFRKNSVGNRYLITFAVFWFYLIEQSLRFNFNLLYITLFGYLLFNVYLRLKNYELKDYYGFKHPLLKKFAMFMARYSMQVFTIHLILFKLIKAYIIG